MAKRLQLLSPLKGDPGDPGVYVGNTEPTDDSVRVWIDPDDNASPDVVAGSDGGYYTPTVTQPETDKFTINWSPSKSDMPTVAPDTIVIPAGQSEGGQGVHIGAGEPPDSNVSVWIDTDETDATDYIPTPTTAQVGQTIVVKEVDEYGKPVSWECADVASGAGTTGDEKWELIADISTTEAVDALSQTWVDTPMRKIRINLVTVAAETATNYMSVSIATDNSGSSGVSTGRFYVTPLPTTSAKNYEYFAEIFKLGDDVAVCLTESSGGITTKGDASISRGIINGNTGVKSAVSLGNGPYGRALSEQITGVYISTYGTFAEGTKMTIWGVRL